MTELEINLKNYLEEINKELKEHKEKYRKEKPGDSGFHYDKEKTKLMTVEEHMRIRNISEQKLHINRLLKLMK